MQKSINDRRDTLEMVNTLGQDILLKLNNEAAADRLTEDLQDLNTRWSDIPVLLDERILKLEKGIKNFYFSSILIYIVKYCKMYDYVFRFVFSSRTRI